LLPVSEFTRAANKHSLNNAYFILSRFLCLVSAAVPIALTIPAAIASRMAWPTGFSVPLF
jgi:hypothetical protein